MENPNIREDLVRLRDELIPRAFVEPPYGGAKVVRNATLA